MRILLTVLIATAPALGQTTPPSAPTQWEEFDRSEKVAGGISYRERRFYRGGEGPFTMQVLEVDPKDPRINLLPVRGQDRLNAKATVSSMARRYGAAAAVNGGYFVVTGPYAGASTGAWQFRYQPVYAGSGRSGAVFCAEEADFVERISVARIEFRGEARIEGGPAWPIAGLNRERGAGELIAYLPQFGGSTLTPNGGVEAALDSEGRVIRKQEETGNSEIPRGGLVLSGSGPAAEWLKQHAVEGARIEVHYQLEAEPAVCKAEDILGAGPRIVAEGKVAVSDEGFAHAAVRHPRTAVAVTGRGTILLVTVDGRQASSIGMRLDELAAELTALGAREAVNLDGGGSTTMVVRGRIRNSPSDGQERPVSDALLVFSTGSREELRELLETLGRDAGQISPELLSRLRERLQGDLVEFRRMVEAAEGKGVSAAAARLLREGAYAASAKEH